MKVVIAGGGTAGHVNPALALAGALQDEDVVFVGTIQGLEARLVTAAGFPFETIEVVGFDRSRPATFPRVALTALAAVRRSRRILGRLDPDVVVGMGGYVSLPVSVGAASRRIPLVLHEQNIVLGLAHRVAQPFARRVAVSFQETLDGLGAKGVLTGNPVAARVAELDRAALRSDAASGFGLASDVPTVLVFGGSLGARTLNAAAVELAQLWRDRTDRQILHITGRSQASRVAAVSPAPKNYVVREFVPEMETAYAAADIALCRGGASTIAELTAVGLPAVVVPYPHHRDRQQELHGRSLERAGAGVVIADAHARGERVASILDRLLEPNRLSDMTVAARSLGRRDAADRLAEVVRGASG